MKQGGNSTATILPESGDAATLALLDEPNLQPTAEEEVESRLDQARGQLLELRRQQEELERQKGELEELRRRQDEFSRGRAEMIENLTRGLVTIDREQIQAQRLAELCDKTQLAFRDYLEQIQSINDEEWTSDTVRTELSKALGVIENSRLEYNRARTKLDCLNPGAGQPEAAAETQAKSDMIEGTELLRYMCIGAAASAPLILAGTVWLIVALVAR